MTKATLSPPTLESLREAHDRIRPWVHRTPVMTCQSLDDMVGAHLFFKCENLQKVGAFKFRGASNAVLNLSEEEFVRGVVTHSSGNHAQALALAARNRGAKAYIVMPNNAPEVKKAAVAGYGAEIIFCVPTLQARESTTEEVIARTGATFVHPYDDYDIIAGQSTACIELLEEVPDLDLIMAPVGGGGLLSGTLLATHYLAPDIPVVAAEPEGADDAYRSFKSGEFVPSQKPDTIADGLLTSLGEKTFDIMLRYVKDVVTVSEAGIVQAMRHTWERAKTIIEPSSAVPFGSLLEGKVHVEGIRVGIIISGGNVDLEQLPWSPL